MGRLDDKVAVITGAGRGIGREIALMMASEGASVVVNDLGANTDGTGTGKVADDVAAEIRDLGGEAVSNTDSVASVQGGENLVKTAIDAFGAMDILVNNAGILRDRTIFKMEEEDWDAVQDVHLKGHYSCSRPFARYVRDNNRTGCRIINFSSVSGLIGNFGQANYGAAKAGIAGFSRVLALELAKYGCTVNTISPGALTRMTIPLRENRGEKVGDHDLVIFNRIIFWSFLQVARRFLSFFLLLSFIRFPEQNSRLFFALFIRFLQALLWAFHRLNEYLNKKRKSNQRDLIFSFWRF
jgi:NAD(P)-dependent dehydrogenase (short-subunit alcohol dehydrogenase family)